MARLSNAPRKNKPTVLRLAHLPNCPLDCPGCLQEKAIRAQKKAQQKGGSHA